MFSAFMGISEGAIPFALESPHHRHSVLYGRRDCRLNRRCLAGRSAMVPGVRYLGMASWSLTSASTWRGSRWGAVITALMVVFLRLMMFRKGKLLIDSL